MKTQKKKLAAAIAAVYAHLSTTEQVAYAPEHPSTIAPPAPAGQASLWGLSGRQTQMQANTMMQLRAFK